MQRVAGIGVIVLGVRAGDALMNEFPPHPRTEVLTVSSTPPLPFTRPSIDEETIAAVAEVLRSGWLASGPKVAQLEAELSRVSGRAAGAHPDLRHRRYGDGAAGLRHRRRAMRSSRRR